LQVLPTTLVLNVRIEADKVCWDAYRSDAWMGAGRAA
jgi:hypothetical protein